MPIYNKLFNTALILDKLDIKEGQKIADLGCGKFEYFIKPIAKMIGDKGVLYAVDIIKDIVEDIKKEAWNNNLKQVKAIWSDLEVYKGTKINSTSIDKALLINVLNQSEKKVEILRESIRLLKTGGTLLVVDWQLTAAPFGPEPHRRVNPDSIKEAAPKLNLELIDEFSAGDFHYALIFNKL
jgi:ubiquinone/menaquinone biosynthesis C-methylase UbiE